MGIIIRQSIQNTIVSYIGIGLGFVSTILLFPNILTSDQFGLTRLMLSVSLICVQISQLGMKNVIIRYFPYFQRSDSSRYRLLSLAIGIPAAGFLLFTVLLFLFHDTLVAYYAEESNLFEDYVFYLIPLVFAILFFEVLNSYVRAMKDSVTGSVVNEVIIRLLIIALLVAYAFDLMTFQHFMMLFVGIYCVQPLYMLIYLAIKNRLGFSHPFQSETKRLYKGMGVYGFYSVLGGLATLMVGNIDIIMLGAMVDYSSAAVYAIAFYMGTVIAVPQRSINKIAAPLIAGFFKSKQLDEIETLYQRTALNQLIAGSLLYVGIWANLHNVMDLLPPIYAGIYWVVVILGLAKLFDMATGINGHIIINSRFFRFDLYTNILLAILTISTNYLLIPQFGLEGAAIATALSIFIYNFVKFVFVWIKFGMQPFQLKAIWIIVIAGLCLLLSEQLPYMINFFVDVAVRSLLILILFTSAVLILRVSDDFQRLVMEALRRIKNILTRN